MDQALSNAKMKLWNIIERIGIGMLTTRDDEVLRSRPMAVHADPGSDQVWLFAHADDHLPREIGLVSDVNISFVDTSKADYVSVSGRAQLINDRDRAAKLWTPALDSWYPAGLDNPQLRLIRVDLIQGEYWDTESRSMVRLWEAAKTSFTDGSPDLTEQRKVSLDS